MNPLESIPCHAPASGFTRIDLLAAVLVVALLALLCGSALATTRVGADRSVCLNNLRRIGQAALGWGLNHQGLFPWRTPVSDGGTRPDSGTKAGNAWAEFAYLSNYLVTPKILACPADTWPLKKIADTWGRGEGGFTDAKYRGHSVSYFVGLDTSPVLPSIFLSGDRNLRVDATAVGCSAGINNVSGINSRPVRNGAWTNDVHGEFGHILFSDGRVALFNTEQLRETLPWADDNGSIHVLFPR